MNKLVVEFWKTYSELLKNVNVILFFGMVNDLKRDFMSYYRNITKHPVARSMLGPRVPYPYSGEQDVVSSLTYVWEPDLATSGLASYMLTSRPFHQTFLISPPIYPP